MSVDARNNVFTVRHCHDNLTEIYNFRLNFIDDTILQWSKCGVLSGGGLQWEHENTNTIIQEFCSRIGAQCSIMPEGLITPWISDKVWLQDKGASISSVSFKFLGRQESRVFGIWVGVNELPKQLAIIPITHLKLYVIGNRVLCHSNIPILHPNLPQQANNFIDSTKIIIFNMCTERRH